jgi:hypothetical protein
MKPVPIANLPLIIALLGVWAPRASADPITLAHLNSTVAIDPHSVDGLFGWTVDGVDHIFEQSFWFRPAASGPAANISTLGVAHSVGANGRTASVSYTSSDFQVDLDYTLTGRSAGSGVSRMTELTSIHNLTDRPLDFSLWQETDFDVNDSPGGDKSVFTSPGSFEQRDNGKLARVMVGLAPDGWQMSLFPMIFLQLNSDAPDLLDCCTPLGPGDIALAFQWDFTLAPVSQPGSTFTIATEKAIVPEPGTLVLFAIGLGGLAAARAKRRS